jgi:hypothetical protein
MSDPTREQQLQEVQDIADQVSELIAQRHHGATLDALMTVYAALAMKFDCCTQNAANQCFQTSVQLAQHAAVQRAGIAPADAASAPTHLH